MGCLEDKLFSLATTDTAIAATLETDGAVMKTKDKPDKLDVTKVDRKLIAKAKAHVHAELKVPKPFVYEGHTIRITALSLDGDKLRVDLKADCPTDGPYFFVNPPLQVVTTEAVMDAVDTMKVKTPRVTADAPDDVLKTIVGQAVHAVAVQKDWTPK
jgi:hypothetical protein